MAFDGVEWRENAPTNSDLANEIDDWMRDDKIACRGRLAQEHVWPSSQSSTAQAGFHKYITFQAQTSTPGLVYGTSTQNGCIFTDTANNLMFENSAGGTVALVVGNTNTGGLMPAGVFVPYAGVTNVPTGWLLCDGQAISRTSYPRLFNAISTIWGTGDGSTTFNVPDMQGFVVVGKSAGGVFATYASSTGAVSHTLTDSEIPAHTHSVAARNNNSGGSSDLQRGDGSGSLLPVTPDSFGGGAAHNNVQPSKVARYIIKD